MKRDDGLHLLLDAMSQHLTKAQLYASNAMVDLSVLITKCRLERGQSQAEFAAYMGVSQGMVSKWESGDYNFTFRTAAQICEKLDRSFSISCPPAESSTAFSTARIPPASTAWIASGGKNAVSWEVNTLWMIPAAS